MQKFIDLTGKRFGKLMVIGGRESIKTLKESKPRVYWDCLCDCGNQVKIRGDQLKNGHTNSCGCYEYRCGVKHNLSNTKLHYIYKSMKNRCFNKNVTGFNRYGGRGITICEEWENSFKSFYDWSIKNGYVEGLSIDRINNNGNYEPANCRWVTKQDQANNTSSNVLVSYFNEYITLSELSIRIGIKYKTVHARYKKGWSIEKIINTPLIANKKIKK